VLDELYRQVSDHYVEPDTAIMIVNRVKQRQREGAYDRLTEPVQFAEAVTRDLRALNHDLHLSLRYNPQGSVPPPSAMRRIVGPGGGGPGAPTGPGAGPTRRIVRNAGGPGGGDAVSPSFEDEPAGMDSAFVREAQRRNFGLSKVEVLPGNVGYLNVTGFMGAPGSNQAIADALGFLERTDAILIDMRQNPGGNGQMSHYLFSHFLPATPIPTIQIKTRESREPFVMRSVAKVLGPRRTEVPLYVLTSRGTGSAAEEFSSVLKNTRRATLVGEVTAGAGHMVNHFPLPDGFTAGVSITRVSDPRTGAEWEATGVQPDVAVPADRALPEAHMAALRDLAAKSDDPARRRRLEWAAEWVEADARRDILDATRAQAVVGRYEGERAVTLVDGRLMYARAARPAMPLVPLRDGGFALNAETRISFGTGLRASALEETRIDGTRSTYGRVGQD
jgi:hypothetical protein